MEGVAFVGGSAQGVVVVSVEVVSSSFYVSWQNLTCFVRAQVRRVEHAAGREANDLHWKRHTHARVRTVFACDAAFSECTVYTERNPRF